MKQKINLDIGEHHFEIDIDFRIIEIAERVFDATADMVLGVYLVDPRTTKRTLVARTISEWVGVLPSGVKRSELYEYVLTCSSKELAVYAGCIQGAIGYSLKYIGPDEVELLSKGKDLPPKTAEAESQGASQDPASK